MLDDASMTVELHTIAIDANKKFRAEISVFLRDVSDNRHKTGEVYSVANTTIVIAC